MFLNLFLFYQVVRPLGRKSVNKYLYLYLYLYLYYKQRSRIPMSRRQWSMFNASWTYRLACTMNNSRSVIISRKARHWQLPWVNCELLRERPLGHFSCWKSLSHTNIFRKYNIRRQKITLELSYSYRTPSETLFMIIGRHIIGRVSQTRSSATSKSTARLSCLAGILNDISREKICWWLINHFYVIGDESYRILRNNAK